MAKRSSKNGAKKTPAAPVESELGRRLRKIKDEIAASGVYLFQNDEEVLEEVRRRRAGPITENDTDLRRLAGR